MTINYMQAVATARYWTFLRLLLRWKGSIYKIIWFEFVLFLLAYFGLSCLYHYGLFGDHKMFFETICRFCKKYGESIPISFVLGFYVSLIVTRWWDQFTAIPWPDSFCLAASALLNGNSDEVIMFTKTMVRYMNLSYCIALSSISRPVKKIFPNPRSFVDNGLMTEEELECLESFDTKNSKYFLPIRWAHALVNEASKKGHICGILSYAYLAEELDRFRGSLGTLFAYDWINPPLVYTQITTISVHAYFFAMIFGEQFTIDIITDIKVPIFAILKFFFFMGWLKVAESLINPFGEDDDDFEMLEMIRRNLQVSDFIIEEMKDHTTLLETDPRWSQSESFEPSFSSSNADMFIGSLTNINFDNKDHENLIGSKLSIIYR